MAKAPATGGPVASPFQAPAKQTPPGTSADPKDITGVPTQMGAKQPSAYQQTIDQFNQQPQPDPNTFIQQLWPHLTSHQQDLVKAIMSNPQSQGGQPADQGAPQPPASPMM